MGSTMIMTGFIGIVLIAGLMIYILVPALVEDTIDKYLEEDEQPHKSTASVKKQRRRKLSEKRRAKRAKSVR